jgi:hypothetical protein
VLLLAISSACTYNVCAHTATGSSAATALATQTVMRASVSLVSVSLVSVTCSVHNSLNDAQLTGVTGYVSRSSGKWICSIQR